MIVMFLLFYDVVSCGDFTCQTAVTVPLQFCVQLCYTFQFPNSLNLIVALISLNVVYCYHQIAELIQTFV